MIIKPSEMGLPENFAPMLAASSANEDLETLRFPLYATPKLDGIRCLIVGGIPVTRTMHTIPNKHIFRKMCNANLPTLDGELICPGKPFNETSSAIMSEDGTPDFEYVVFDYYKPDTGYMSRINGWVFSSKMLGIQVRMLKPTRCDNLRELNEYTEACVKQGYEGTIARTMDGPYKFNRSTWKEQYMIKFKPFVDDEAEITGFIEAFENTNKADKDVFGDTKRSSHQANMVPKDTLGAFVVNHKKYGTFQIGTGIGLTAELRQEVWKNQKKYKGKLIRFRYQLHGTKDKPRTPSFQGFRDRRDL